MPNTAAPKVYDPTEALDLLAHDKSREQLTERMDAARQLLTEMLELGEPSEAPRLGKFGFRNIVLKVDEDGGGVRVFPPSESDKPIPTGGVLAPLVYDPIPKKWCGRDFDQYVVPTPGQPWPKRSALAVVVEAALRMINAPAKPSP
jgi:hypothetical protein